MTSVSLFLDSHNKLLLFVSQLFQVNEIMSTIQSRELLLTNMVRLKNYFFNQMFRYTFKIDWQVKYEKNKYNSSDKNVRIKTIKIRFRRLFYWT